MAISKRRRSGRNTAKDDILSCWAIREAVKGEILTALLPYATSGYV